MSKPVRPVTFATIEGREVALPALFDTGSFYSLVREDRVPRGTVMPRYRRPQTFGTAKRGGRVRVTGVIEAVITIGVKRITDSVMVSPDLSRELILGAGTMQKWDISVRKSNGSTRITVGRDMRDPEITEVD